MKSDLTPGSLIELRHGYIAMYFGTEDKTTSVDAVSAFIVAVLPHDPMETDITSPYDVPWAYVVTENRSGWAAMWPDMYNVVSKP